MGAVKNYYHDEICRNGVTDDERQEAEFYDTVDEVGCPYAMGDLRRFAWLEGFGAALDWAQKNFAGEQTVSQGEDGAATRKG